MAIILVKDFSGLAGTQYITDHNSNYVIIEDSINSLLAFLGSTSGANAQVPNGLREIFDRDGIIGVGSYLPPSTAPSNIMTVAAGAAWVALLFAQKATTSTIDLTSFADGTLFLNVDSLGEPNVTNSQNSLSLYSFTWTDAGDTITDITLLVDILFDGDDYNDMLDSATTGLTFTSVADRLESMEAAAEALRLDPVVNPGMNIWQRETTFTGVADEDMLADQYEIELLTDVGIMDVSRVVPTAADIFAASGQRINYALRVDVTTIDASIATTEFVTLSQKIIGYNAAPFMHNQFTVSFFARSNLTGQYAMAVGNDGDDRNFIKTWNLASADVWERISIVVDSQNLSGSWDYLTGIGLNLRWTLAAGATHFATDNIWNSTADFAVTGMQNFLSSTSNYLELTGVQLDLGAVAKPYRGIPIEQDFDAANLFFQKSYDIGVFPGATSALGQVAFHAVTTSALTNVQLFTHMPAAPTIITYNPTDGATGEWEIVGTGQGLTTVSGIGSHGFVVSVGSTVNNDVINGHWTAEFKL